MNYDERCIFAYDTIVRLENAAIEKEGTYDGVTISIDFEKNIPSIMRKEMAEIIERNDLIFRIVEFKSKSITVEFKGRTVQMIVDDIRKEHEYQAQILEDDYVFDENESVKWNREQVALHNKEELEMVKQSKAKIQMLEDIWKKKIFDDAREKLGKDIPDKALESIFYNAYEEGHSGGYMEVYGYFDEYVDMIQRFASNLYTENDEGDKIPCSLFLGKGGN